MARPAATVVVVRDTVGGPEVLLLRRPRSGFAPGAWVFPGGIVDDHDSRLLEPIPEAWRGWSRRLAIEDPAEAVGYVLAAIREAWEETGVLLGSSRAAAEEVRDVRRELVTNRVDYPAAAAAIGFVPELDSIVYLARWVTPMSEPRRYDTRFFLAGVPEATEATLEGEELLEARWMTPAEAVRGWEEKHLPMLAPTVHTLRRLVGFSTTGVMLDHLRDAPVPSFLPRIERRPDGATVLVEELKEG